MEKCDVASSALRIQLSSLRHARVNNFFDLFSWGAAISPVSAGGDDVIVSLEVLLILEFFDFLDVFTGGGGGGGAVPLVFLALVTVDLEQ